MKLLKKNQKYKTRKLVERFRLPKIVIRTVFGDCAEFDSINDPSLSRVLEDLTLHKAHFTIYLEYCQYKDGRIVYDGRSRYDLNQVGREGEEEARCSG